MMNELLQAIIHDNEIIIYGEPLEDGSIDPGHMQVEMDDRFYFHVYTSKKSLINVVLLKGYIEHQSIIRSNFSRRYIWWNYIEL